MHTHLALAAPHIEVKGGEGRDTLSHGVEEHEEGPSVMMRKNERERKRRDAREERD